MKHLYFLISFVVLAACATGGAKYSGGEITIDPAVQSNRHVTYMPVSVNELAKAALYVESKGVSLTESTENTKHAQQIAQNNAERIKAMFTLLYKVASGGIPSGITDAEIINIYKISGISTIDSCNQSTCKIKTEGTTLNEIDINTMIQNLQHEESAIKQTIEKFFNINESDSSLSFITQNLSDVSFTTSTLEENKTFKYILDEDNKITKIKYGDNEYIRTSDDSANFESIEIVSLAKNLIELNKTQKFIGLSYADFGFINKDSNKQGIYFADYSNKRITLEDGKTEFTTVDSKTGKTVQIDSPTFSGKAVMLIKDNDKSSFQEGVAELAYDKNYKKATLEITSSDYKVTAEHNGNLFTTMKFTNLPTGSNFDKEPNAGISGNLYYYSNNGKSIQEAAGTLNYIQNDNTYFKSAFGVAIPRQ